MADQPKYLGPEAIESHTGSCGFKEGPVGSTGPACLAEATWHGLLLDRGDGCVALMSCCDEHKPAMALTAEYIHPYETACSMPEATIWWNDITGDSGCRIDWDTDVLAAAEPVHVGSEP